MAAPAKSLTPNQAIDAFYAAWQQGKLGCAQPPGPAATRPVLSAASPRQGRLEHAGPGEVKQLGKLYVPHRLVGVGEQSRPAAKAFSQFILPPIFMEITSAIPPGQQPNDDSRRSFMKQAGGLLGVTLALPFLSQAERLTALSKTLPPLSVRSPMATPVKSLTPNQAMDAFYAAWQQGKWAEFFALFADDFTFEFPAGPLMGRHTGAAAHEKAQTWREQSQKMHLTSVTETLRLCTNGWVTSCAISEGTSAGTRSGQPYHGVTAVYLHVQHGQIVEYREYLGGLS